MTVGDDVRRDDPALWPAPPPVPPRPIPAGVRLPGVTVVVVTQRTELADLVRATAAPGTRIGLHRWREGDVPVAAGQIAAELAAVDVGVVCIGDDMPLDLAFELAALVDREHAHMATLLLATPWPEVWRDALRAGVRDVVDPHGGAADLEQALAGAVERAARMRELRSAAAPTAAPTARVIAVLSPKGGSGKTMVASNLTAALAGASEGPVALVDLDVQFGDAASALGLVPEHTIGQLALTPEIDSTALKVFLTPHEPSGAYVLCGAASPAEGEMVSDQQAVRVVELLEQDFACVVVDTPAGLDERTLAVVDRATDLVFVATLDVSSIRNLGKEIEALDRLGMGGATRHFVLNRADARVGIEPGDVQAALGLAVDVSVPSARALPLSMNQGRPLVLDDPASPVARELIRFARKFVPGDGDGDGAGPGGDGSGAWLRRLRR